VAKPNGHNFTCLSKTRLQICVQQAAIHHHSISITVLELQLLDSITFLLLAYSVNREIQKHFHYSNNFRL